MHEGIEILLTQLQSTELETFTKYQEKKLLQPFTLEA